MAPSLQEVEDILLKSYKFHMNEVMTKNYLTFLEICECHRVLCSNILEALEQAMTPQVLGPYKKHMTKAFETQLHVSLLKRQQQVQTIGREVEEMTQSAIKVYQKFLETTPTKYADAMEKKEYGRAFRELTTEARDTSVKYFLDNCHFSTEKALLFALKEKEEDFLDDFREKYGDFEIPAEVPKENDNRLSRTGISNGKGIPTIILPEDTTGKTSVSASNETNATQNLPEIISDDALSDRASTGILSDDEIDIIDDTGFVTPGTEFSSAASLNAKAVVEENRNSSEDVHKGSKHELNHAVSDASSGYISRESSFALDTEEQSTLRPDSHWWTTIGNVTRRGSDSNSANSAFKQAFQTIATTTKPTAKSISRLVVFFGATNIYARYFDDANGKSGKSAQTIQPYILLGHQILIGEFAMQVNPEDTQNVLTLLYENPSSTLDHQKLSAEEILAEFLRQIHLTLAGGDTTIQEYIVIYSAHLTHFQKRRLTIAADLADFKPPIFLSLHTFLAALQMTCEGIKDGNAMMLHFSPKGFDVIIAHLDSHRPAISSYTGSEDLDRPARFHIAHSNLIHFAATQPGEDMPPATQRVAGRFYKEIISKGLNCSNLEWSDIDSIVIIYDPSDLELNLDSAFDSADISEDLNANEMDESEVLNAAISEVTFEQAAEVQDIHVRNFGIIVNNEVTHFYEEKNIPIEEDEEIEAVLSNIRVGWNKITVGCETENETYRFRVENEGMGDVVVTIKSDPVFLYNVSIRTTEEIELDVENLSFPYLCEL